MTAAKVGLSGGIGSGKSTVAAVFSELGVTVIDADQIAREVTAPGRIELNQITDHFGKEILNPDGSLNRDALRQKVFETPHKRVLLEQILHPAIRQTMHAMANADTGDYCVLEIPLLVESGQYQEMDRVLIVTCPREIRIQRISESRGLDESSIIKIMDAQSTDEERVAIADDVIDNSRSREQVKRSIEQLHRQYTALFSG